MNRKLASNETAAFQGNRIEHTLITARLIATAIWIEIDVCHRLRNAKATTDKRIAICVNGCHECCVCRIESHHWRCFAEVWFRRIKAWASEIANVTNVNANIISAIVQLHQFERRRKKNMTLVCANGINLQKKRTDLEMLSKKERAYFASWSHLMLLQKILSNLHVLLM